MAIKNILRKLSFSALTHQQQLSFNFIPQRTPSTNGQEYERLAEDYLSKQGLTSIARNYYCRYGEIDLIMIDQQQLVFVEVKYRQNKEYGAAEEFVDKRKQKKIRLCAEHFIQCHYRQINFRQFLLNKWQNTDDGNYPAIRFDILAINGTIADKSSINWIKNAFLC